MKKDAAYHYACGYVYATLETGATMCRSLKEQLMSEYGLSESDAIDVVVDAYGGWEE